MALKAGRVGVAKNQVDEFGNIIGGGGGSINVVNNLTSNSTTDALSAKQGKVLKGLVDNLSKTNVQKHYITLANSDLGIHVNSDTDNYYVEIGNKVIVMLAFSTTNQGNTYSTYKIAENLPPCADFYIDLNFPSTILVDNKEGNDLSFGIGQDEHEGELIMANRSGRYTAQRYVVIEYYKKEV